jgi:dGTPase
MSDVLFELRHELDRDEQRRLSPRAALSRDAVRRRPDPTAGMDHRQHFAIDADRILHSMAYTRYIDKTQVFSLVKNDHITHRVLHVQLVSRIARTVGRHLGLNEDLIEAAALGHDLGHAPFGHDGEAILSRLCEEAGIGHFVHAVQSVEFLENIEKGGRGLNLTLQVLDGILCHDGEVDLANLRPDPARGFDEFDSMVQAKKADPKHPVTPMTTEGCVVRLADTISYIGRDIEDAIRLGLLNRSDLPSEPLRLLGNTNGKIVYNLVSDLIQTSRTGERVAFSSPVAEALLALKDFNRQSIYYNPRIKTQRGKVEELYRTIFERLSADLDQGRPQIPEFARFWSDTDERYRDEKRPAEIVRDFMAGMTDEFFLFLGRRLLIPEYLSEYA